MVGKDTGGLLKRGVAEVIVEEEMVKLLHNMGEEGRISLRTIRRDSKELLEKQEKSKIIAEDDKFRGIDDLQKLVDKYIARIDEISKSKEKEILEF